MRQIIIILLLMIFCNNVFAIDITKLLWESAIETDRHQSYQWHFSTKDNPVRHLERIEYVNEYHYRKIYNVNYESNPLVSGTDRETFDKIIDDTKLVINNWDKIFDWETTKHFYYGLLMLELYNIYNNNQYIQERDDYAEIWTLAYSWEF